MNLLRKISEFLTLRKKKRFIKDQRSRSMHKYSILSIVVLFVILIIMNVLVDLLAENRFVDLTAQKMNSVSEETRKVLTDLPAEVQIIGLFERPENLESSIYQLFVPLLDKYEELSEGKMSVSYYDPDVYPSIVFGLDPTGSTSFSKDTYVVKSGDRFVIIDPMDCLIFDSYEYSVNNRTVIVGNSVETVFTGSISYLVSGDLKRAYFTNGHSESGSSTIRDLLRYDGYECKDLYLEQQGGIPDDCEVIIINLPKSDFTENEAGLLSDFLSDGGKIIMVSDFSSYPTEMTNLYALAEKMRISITSDIIRENSPEFMLVADNNYYSKGIVSDAYSSLFGIEFVTVGESRSIQLGDYSESDATVRPILASSSNAVAHYVESNPTENLVEGTKYFALHSAIDGRTGRGEMIVLGTGFISADEYISSLGTNDDGIRFFRYLIHSLTGKTVQTPIPAKFLPSYDFTNMPSVSEQTIWTVMLIAIIPFVFISAGIIVYYRRKHK